MKKNRFGFPENPLSSISKEELRMENEILRMKLKAQTGGDLRHSGKELPPEVEYLFLKNILAFEESYSTATLISVFDYLGRPVHGNPDEMTDEELETSLPLLTDILFSKNLTVDFGKLTDARLKYAFIVRDLFPHQINDIKIGGMFLHFQYEEFNPDHEKDLRARAMEFISDWFERTMGKFSWQLAEKFVLPDGAILSRDEMIEKFRQVFAIYKGFRDCQYLLKNVSFEVNEGELTGSGYVEGAVKYHALLENGEKKYFDDAFKLFLIMENNCWRIFYFNFPGFEW